MTDAAAPEVVTIVTQTRVRPGREHDFARWRASIGQIIAKQPGFIDEKVMPPSPPAQVDWVILQRFVDSAAAIEWLRSDTRIQLLDSAQEMLSGSDDVHIVKDTGAGVMPSPASAVISTRVRPGREDAYRQWERRIAAAQSRAPGFQGHRIEPPVPGVQDDWLAIVRFDSEANLQTWMQSEERASLLKETPSFIGNFRARIVRTGFDQWFPTPASSAPPPSRWKQNMIVILSLIPSYSSLACWCKSPC